MNEVNFNGYDAMLLNLIPSLKQFPSKSGGEGIVYFIDKNFVVKSYTAIAKENNVLYKQEFFEMNMIIFIIFWKKEFMEEKCIMVFLKIFFHYVNRFVAKGNF